MFQRRFYSNQSGLGLPFFPEGNKRSLFPQPIRGHWGHTCSTAELALFGGLCKSGGDSTKSKGILPQGGVGLFTALLYPRDGAETSMELWQSSSVFTTTNLRFTHWSFPVSMYSMYTFSFFLPLPLVHLNFNSNLVFWGIKAHIHHSCSPFWHPHLLPQSTLGE